MADDPQVTAHTCPVPPKAVVEADPGAAPRRAQRGFEVRHIEAPRRVRERPAVRAAVARVAAAAAGRTARRNALELGKHRQHTRC